MPPGLAGRSTIDPRGLSNCMPIARLKIKELVMAKLIEFYKPKNFTKTLEGAGQVRRGEVVEFSQTKKTA